MGGCVGKCRRSKQVQDRRFAVSKLGRAKHREPQQSSDDDVNLHTPIQRRRDTMKPSP
jgi:hypothetical protein